MCGPFCLTLCSPCLQTPSAWDGKFENVCISSAAPVAVTEWSLDNDANACYTPGFDGRITDMITLCLSCPNEAKHPTLEPIQTASPSR